MTDQTLERFWDKVQVQQNGCWNWIGWHTQEGYGLFRNNTKQIMAHRFAYEVNKGQIANGLTLDHLCRNTCCVNPDHLEAVTMKMNISRGVTNACAVNSKKTHCPLGHPLSGDNLYITKGRRWCRTCKNSHDREYRQRKSRENSKNA